MLALNRGEELKILSVKVVVPDTVQSQWLHFCDQKYAKNTFRPARRQLISDAIRDAYSRIGQCFLIFFL